MAIVVYPYVSLLFACMCVLYFLNRTGHFFSSQIIHLPTIIFNVTLMMCTIYYFIVLFRRRRDRQYRGHRPSKVCT